jgi:nucleoside phosphorylase
MKTQAQTATENTCLLVVAPTPVEWASMNDVLSNVKELPDQSLPTAIGFVDQMRVVCVQSGKGISDTAVACQYLVEIWHPRWVFLVGIAGGFSDMGVRRGDVVIAKHVYSFDFGKLVDGKYIRRPDYDYGADRRLLDHAMIVAETGNQDWLRSIAADARPDGQSSSETNLIDGYVASSDKVVDDPDHSFFQAVKATMPELHAVEMEACGAGAAIRFQQTYRTIGLLMIRGISDESNPSASAGSEQRKEWRKYASTVAALFTREVIVRLVSLSGTPLEDTTNDASEFIKDVTIPDGTIVRVGETFVKTWEIRNVGCVPWRGRHLKRIGASTGSGLLSSPDIVSIPDTMPGQVVQISVPLTAPGFEATTTCCWKMVDTNGKLCFPERYPDGLNVIVHVVK